MINLSLANNLEDIRVVRIAARVGNVIEEVLERHNVIGEVGEEREVGCRVNFRRACEFVPAATTADGSSVEGGGS